jgi:hypothetical protein
MGVQVPVPDVAVRLEDRARVAGLYYQALTQRRPAFHLLDDIAASPVPPDTDDTLRLPAVVDFFQDPRGNWDWYLVALSYRAMAHHPTLGTYAEPTGGTNGRELVRRFLAERPTPSTALVVLGVLDGIRLDAVLLRTLPGVRQRLERVQRHALDSLVLADLAQLSPRVQLLTCLLAASLAGEPLEVHVSPVVAAALPECLDMADWMASAPPLSSALSAAGTLYQIVAALPPMAMSSASEAVVLRAPVPVPRPDVAPDAVPSGRSHRAVKHEGSERFGVTLPEVLYRGVLGTRHMDHRDSGRLSDPAIIAWREGLEGDHHDHHDHHHGPPDHEHPDDEDAPPPEPIAHEHGEVPRWEIPHLPPVAVNRGNVFHYPEWDSERGAYRPNWCRVVEEPLEASGFTSYGREVLDAHRPTVMKLLREWGRLPREGLTLARSLPDGDQIDIDAALDVRVELRAGAGSDANVYTRKVPVGRDVVCTILVDVSMSTADHIEPDPDQPFTVDEAAMRLYGRPYRTVLDHERETTLLLAEIMERVSDLSIIYSFSSTGRNNVRLQRIKGVRERSRIATASRLQNLRPLDATRMGAAVRHASAQLRRTDARSKMLVVISDGLPYDEDYGDEYGPRKDAYAINDTVRAFDEAEASGIRSVLFLTGDQDLGRLADLGHRAVHVPHPGGLAEAVVSRYLRAREVSQRGVRP